MYDDDERGRNGRVSRVYGYDDQVSRKERGIKRGGRWRWKGGRRGRALTRTHGAACALRRSRSGRRAGADGESAYLCVETHKSMWQHKLSSRTLTTVPHVPPSNSNPRRDAQQQGEQSISSRLDGHDERGGARAPGRAGRPVLRRGGLPGCRGRLQRGGCARRATGEIEPEGRRTAAVVAAQAVPQILHARLPCHPSTIDHPTTAAVTF